jgi:hypothetical protein
VNIVSIERQLEIFDQESYTKYFLGGLLKKNFFLKLSSLNKKLISGNIKENIITFYNNLKTIVT